MRTEKRSALYWSGVVSASLAAAFVSAACSDPEDPGLGSQAGAPGSQAGAPSFGGSLAAGGGPSTNPGPGTGGSQGINIPNPSTAGNSSSGDSTGEKCAGQTSKADLRPVNMFIQFDRSGSMLQNDKWAQATEALNAFFRDPASDGLKVALRFFPDHRPMEGCWGIFGGFGGPPRPPGGGQGMGGAGGMMPAAPTCVSAACAQPLVPLGLLTKDAAPLDTHEMLLVDAVANSTPEDPMTAGGDTGGTPTYAALEGALQWAAANQMASPNERTVVVLVTDGEPTTCNTNIQAIANLAATALMEHGINTYAIGIEGSREEQMHTIARAGGTERAFFSSNAQTAQTDLLNALNAIRGTVLSCQFPLPEGDDIDPSKINIQFTAASGVQTKLLQTSGLDSCAGSTTAWYYDNPDTPTTITLCPETCATVQADGSAQLEVEVGCQTRIR